MSSEIPINEKAPLQPIHYRYPPLLRGFMLLFAALVAIYTIYFLFAVVNADTPLVFKLLPLIILFVSFNSCLNHLTTLNCVSFMPDRIVFSYLLKKQVQIRYQDVLYMELRKQMRYYLNIKYRDESGAEKLFLAPATFPKTLEIMLVIADLCPNIKLSDKLSGAIDNLRSKAE